MSNCSEQVKSNQKWNVLVCDFDRICLRILEKMLRTCNYQVTACQNAEAAIKLLKEENNFDIMMVDIYMPDMDGLRFIKHICEQRDLPVIAMSADDDEELIKEGFKAGAIDYLVKPIRVENVRHVWMNVYRAQRHLSIKREQSWSSSVTMINESDSGDFQKISGTSGDEDIKCLKKRKLINHSQQVDYANTATKKQRVIWTPELHHKFVAAVTQFRNSKAVPKKILELMNVPGLTRENVASHLQKYRQYQKRVEQQSCRHTLDLMSSKEECFHGHNNIQAEVIATSSLQVRGHPFHVAVNDVDRQMLCFQPTQQHHAMAQIANATDINLAAIVEGSNNVIYHPLASYAYSKMNSKIHVVETPCHWSTFSMEDDLKKEANTSIGGQQFANYAYENVLDFGYNDASPYIEQLDHNAYGCN